MNKDGYISQSTEISFDSQKSQPQPAPLPEPKTEYTVSNAKRYLSAEMSLQLYGPVPDSAFEARRAACLSCEHRFDSSSVKDTIGFCRGCGCGVNERARLSVKLTMPSSECPKGKWAKTAGRHSRLKDRLKALLIGYLLK